jgi:hypothetical protein
MLNEQQTTGMLQFAGLSPSVRGQYLQDVVARKDLGGFNEGERLGEGGAACLVAACLLHWCYCLCCLSRHVMLTALGCAVCFPCCCLVLLLVWTRAPNTCVLPLLALLLLPACHQTLP